MPGLVRGSSESITIAVHCWVKLRAPGGMWTTRSVWMWDSSSWLGSKSDIESKHWPPRKRKKRVASLVFFLQLSSSGPWTELLQWPSGKMPSLGTGDRSCQACQWLKSKYSVGYPARLWAMLGLTCQLSGTWESVLCWLPCQALGIVRTDMPVVSDWRISTLFATLPGSGHCLDWHASCQWLRNKYSVCYPARLWAMLGLACQLPVT